MKIAGSMPLLVAAVLFTPAVFADDSADRAKLIGKWQLQGNGGTISTWLLESKAGSIRITSTQGDQKTAEFECNTAGRECEVKDSGHAVKVSFYYNGPKLVELETRGSEVVKRRFSPNASGDGMEEEIIPIVPGGKTETLHFVRMQVATASK